MAAVTAEQAEVKVRHRLWSDFKFYGTQCLKIRPKAGRLVPFELNKAQQYLHAVAEKQLLEKGYIRILVLKGRQQGISTYIEGRFYWKTTHRQGVKAFILTHEDKATRNLFEMAKRYHDNCPAKLRPATGSDAANALDFKNLDSGYSVGTAGTKAVGRSGTVQYFHGSEVAFWPHADTHSTGVMQSVALLPETEIFLESTANGIGNYFHSQWQLAERGDSDYLAVFLPWYWQDEYKRPLDDDFELTGDEFESLRHFKEDGLTAEHLNWRRYKIMEFTNAGDNGEWKFKQEYPFTAAEAFQTSGDEGLIDPRDVLSARKKEREMGDVHVVGMDPSRFGKDPAAIIHRAGRKAWGLELYKKKSTMELAGIASRILRDPVSGDPTDVRMLFIDVGGLGAGVYDRLDELGFVDEGRVCAVDFGGRAINEKRFVNKRTEIWVEMRDWLQLPGGVDLPDGADGDLLQGELCGPLYTYDSANRYKLERKEDMIKRGLASPNGADALATTFAEPVAPPDPNEAAMRSTVQTITYPV